MYDDDGDNLINDDIIKTCREWTPTSLVMFYNILHKGTDIIFPQHLMPVVYALCDKRIQKLMIILAPGSGKSLLLSTIYPTWLLGHAPDETILGVSSAEDLAKGFIKGCMDYISGDEIFKLCFPGVTPDLKRGWSPTSGIYVTGRRAGSPDASYLACGLQSKSMTGKHARTIILDDLHDNENSATTEQCQGVVRTYVSQLLGRADARGARYILAGRRWHNEDLYGVLQRSEDWVVLTLPAVRYDTKTLYWDVTMPSYIDPETKTKPFECVFTDGYCETFDGKRVPVRKKLPLITEV